MFNEPGQYKMKHMYKYEPIFQKLKKMQQKYRKVKKSIYVEQFCNSEFLLGISIPADVTSIHLHYQPWV